MKKPILIALAAVALLGGGAAVALGSGSADRPAAAAAQQQSTTFTIQNMTCATCPITVRKAMEAVPGVSAVAVDFQAKTARVTYDPRRTTAAAIAAASTNAGYPASAI